MVLMDKKPYDKITVSDITEKAGIARQTFYRNYDHKDDVIFEYARNTIMTDLVSIEKMEAPGKRNDIVLVFNYKYVIKRRKELSKILSIIEIENRILRSMRDFPLFLTRHFKDTLSKEEYAIFRSIILYQIAGSLRLFLDWFVNDMPVPMDTFISMINAMNVPKITIYRNIPTIIIRVNK
jgi:AcrR family transcriptional regulator